MQTFKISRNNNIKKPAEAVLVHNKLLQQLWVGDALIKVRLFDEE